MHELYVAQNLLEAAEKAARQHNNANILVLGASYVGAENAKRICDVFIKERFSGGRHARRIKKIEGVA